MALLPTNIQQEILTMQWSAKYYLINLDCTRNTSVFRTGQPYSAQSLNMGMLSHVVCRQC